MGMSEHRRAVRVRLPPCLVVDYGLKGRWQQ